MDEKIKGLLAYLFGWLGGLIILFGVKDNSQQTKFNACQAIVISVAGMVLSFIFGLIAGFLGSMVSLAMSVLLIIGMVKAYKEEDYELPVISDLTRNIFKSQLGE